MARARSVVDVILGEAVSGSPTQRYNDMRAIASAMVNRSQQLGVPLDDVVGISSQFNAYNRSLPAGVEPYRGMAEAALADVLENGPSHNGTFYATPSASKNLPRGLSEVTRTTGHIYYDDPHDRSIQTRQGYRSPIGAAYTATPSARPESPFSSILDLPQSPMGDVDYANYQPGAVQAAPMQDAPMASFDAGRFGPSAPAFDASRFGEPSYFDLSGLLDAPATFDPDRFGTPAAPATTPQQLQRGLLDQQLQAGILPALSPPPSSWPTAQPTPYVDPVVTTAQQPASPQTVAAQPQAPAIAAPAEVRSGLMSPAEYEQVQAQRAYLSTQPFSNAGLLSGTARGLAGTLGGALLGSLALGPVGGLLGGVIGRQVVTPGGLLNQYPEKPKGRPQGDGSLTDYGRDVASRSDQFSNALNSGSAGLW